MAAAEHLSRRLASSQHGRRPASDKLPRPAIGVSDKSS